MRKNYIGISRDHSGSMQGLRKAATADYNQLISAIRDAALAEQQDTIVNVVKCGTGRNAEVKREVINSSVTMLQPLSEKDYDTEGPNTPLLDSVGELIEMLTAVPDFNDPNVSFVVMVVTDGGENSSRLWKSKLSHEIEKLTRSDRWTFTFRVPKGYGRTLQQFGIPDGNIYEWDPHSRGSMEQSTQATQQAVNNFFKARSAGLRSTGRFYTDMSNVSQQQVKRNLKDITHEITTHLVRRDGVAIKDFVEQELRIPYVVGTSFYQLTKAEKAVQDYKKFLILDKATQRIYSGVSARSLLGLPQQGTIALAPADHQNYDIFIQSNSVNRKLVGNTRLMYWPTARPM